MLVTPRVGVWIETLNIDTIRAAVKSLPAWECGLKPLNWMVSAVGHLSLPAWECGLKL